MRDERIGERIALLQSSPLFVDLHAEELTLLAELCQVQQFEPGELICAAGEAGDCLYIVEAGTLEVFASGEIDAAETVLAPLGPGDFFGEMSMLERTSRAASVRAVGQVTLLALTTEDMFSFSKIYRNGFTVVVINIARMLSQRLRQANDRLRNAQ